MTNLQKIELFLQKICTAYGKDPLDPQEKVTAKLQSLMEVIKDMTRKIGDDKINEFFKHVLSSLAVDTPDGPMKNLYMNTLAEFNKELNSYLN